MPILLNDILQPDQRKAVGIAAGLFVGRRSSNAIVNTKFHGGDHWQNSNGWMGAKPLLTPASMSTLLQIKEGFVSENVIKEVNDRHVQGILGREPLWGFVPQEVPARSTETRRRRFSRVFGFLFGNGNQSTQQPVNAAAQEADDALTVWWDQRQPRKQLKEALTKCLNEDRVLLRFFVPRGLYKNATVPVQPSLTNALQLLHLDIVTSDKGGVFTDHETQRPFALYVYDVDGKKCVDLSYVNESGQTIFQVLSDNPELVVEPIPYDLQGRLWMYELERPALITEQVRAAQKALNLDLTMLMRNVNLAGNLERTIMNAEPPKRIIKVPDANQPTGYREETIDGEFLIGPGVSNMLAGMLIRDEHNKIIGRANPNISYRDPVEISTFVGTRAQLRECILGQVQQLHIMISGDSTVSGRSREQARAEYRGSLQDSKEPLDDGGRWLLETGLRIAAQFCSRSGNFAGLRCDFDARIEDGPVSPEDRSANREDVKAGLLSKETAMSRGGVEDGDAEKERIAQERAEIPELPVTQRPANGLSDGDGQVM